MLTEHVRAPLAPPHAVEPAETFVADDASRLLCVVSLVA
jgi:hypothetical protein